MKDCLSRLGARLGNWNDRHSSHDTKAAASLRWRVLDRIAARLHVLGDRAPEWELSAPMTRDAWLDKFESHRFKEAADGVSAQIVPDGLPDTRRAREPWEFFDGD